MNRPLLLQFAPERVRTTIWSRLYRNQSDKWLPLYQAASLQYSPLVAMELVPGDIISDQIAFTGIYELGLTRRVAKLAAQGGTLVDIGANLGYFPLIWVGCNPANSCIAFEPSPRNIDILRRNVKHNHFARHITLMPLAAGAEGGKMSFDTGPVEQTGWGGLIREPSERCIEVDVVRVDNVLRSNDPISLLKVDTEGADLWALMGCERLLKAGIVNEIWYEENKPRMAALGIVPGATEDYLRSVGYNPTPHGDRSAETVEYFAVRY
jgi:FkbM family methyltransferase